jgi:chromate transporter
MGLQTETTTQAGHTAIPAPSASELFWMFCRVGMTSFGGGTSSWLHREIVEKKGWIGEDEFFDTLALCQALPGLNVTNIAVWMGRRLLGIRGALSACAGIVVIPSVVIVLIALLFAKISHYPLTEVALGGATAAAVALPFSMGLKMSLRIRRAPVPLAVMTATFLAIGVLKWPLAWVAPVCGVASVLWEHFRRETG